MTKSSDDKNLPLIGMAFNEALTRLLNTKPEELAESFAADVSKTRERAKRKIQEIKREIDDGARPKKGRFRL
jgi:hypothetical protein